MVNFTELIQKDYKEENADNQAPPPSRITMHGKEDSLVARIRDAPTFGAFEYLTLIPGDSRSKKTLIETMMGFRGRSLSRPIPTHDLPVIWLTDKITRFPLDRIVGSVDKKKGEFVSFESIYVKYTPTTGFFQTGYKARFYMEDCRLAADKITREIIGQTNQSYTGFMSLDYSIALKDLKHVFLVFDALNTGMNEEYHPVFGTLRLEGKYRQTHEAVISSFLPTMAIAEISTTVARKHKFNPTKAIVTMNDEVLTEVTHMRARGQLRYWMNPQGDQDVRDFEGSEAGSNQGQYVDAEAKENMLRNAGPTGDWQEKMEYERREQKKKDANKETLRRVNAEDQVRSIEIKRNEQEKDSVSSRPSSRGSVREGPSTMVDYNKGLNPLKEVIHTNDPSGMAVFLQEANGNQDLSNLDVPMAPVTQEMKEKARVTGVNPIGIMKLFGSGGKSKKDKKGKTKAAKFSDEPVFVTPLDPNAELPSYSPESPSSLSYVLTSVLKGTGIENDIPFNLTKLSDLQTSTYEFLKNPTPALSNVSVYIRSDREDITLNHISVSYFSGGFSVKYSDFVKLYERTQFLTKFTA